MKSEVTAAVHTPTYVVLPPGIARGAEFARPHSHARNTRNHYGSLQRTQRGDNARPGDVATAMERAKVAIGLIAPEDAGV